MRRTALTIGALLLSAHVMPAGQSPTANAPDLSGIWPGRVVVSLADDPPFLPEGRRRFEAVDREKDPLNRCEPPGVPRIMNLAFPFEIVQTPKVLYILYEYDQHVRRVFIGGTHPKELDPTWLGHSIGRWEGRTLVVDTVGFDDRTWLDMRGHPHSDALHVIERLTLSMDGNSLQYETTIDDPKLYARPWQTVATTRVKRADLTIQEFVCEQ